MGERITADLVLSALNTTLEQRKPNGVLRHSDQGSQHTSLTFGERLPADGRSALMGIVGEAFIPWSRVDQLQQDHGNGMKAEKMLSPADKSTKKEGLHQSQPLFSDAAAAVAAAPLYAIRLQSAGGWQNPRLRAPAPPAPEIPALEPAGDVPTKW